MDGNKVAMEKKVIYLRFAFELTLCRSLLLKSL